MAEVHIARDLEQRLALAVAPIVHDVAKDAEKKAKSYAPATKVWVSRRDGRVRHTHDLADREHGEIPENARFKVKSMQWDRDNRGVGEYTYMRWPRDESSRAYVNLVHCRCVAVYKRGGMAESIEAGPVRVEGNVASNIVTAKGKYVLMAERGDFYPGDLIAEGTFFMSRAARDAAAESRARRHG